MSWIVILILSFVEGLTEFLPISSTGHLILTSAFLGLNDDIFVQNFNIIIQFGAILSVLVLYWRRFFPIRPDFYLKLLVSFLPAAVLGLALKSKIEALLGSVTVVAIALVVGGVLLIWLDRRAAARAPTTSIARMTWTQCLILGFIQCLAFIPGVSRSGATILGALGLGLSREEATEYSFFLAVPTLTAAGLFKTYKALPTLQSDQAVALAAGTVLSFVFALLAIGFFIRLVARFGLQHFGTYRIVLGVAILLLQAGGLL
jgi:undecaprenyl-diphosphatase